MRGANRPRRRDWLRLAAGAAAVSLVGCAAGPSTALRRARVVVVGGGYAGATCARYLRAFSAGALEVVLVEAAPRFVSCPLSNLVVGGVLPLARLEHSYDGLSRAGVQRVQESALAIDAQRRRLRMPQGTTIAYDRLVLAPGVELMLDAVPGLAAAHAQGRVLHAWKAGTETEALRRQLEAMPDGGVFAIAIPEAPYRCPPGPYERACLVADWCRRHKPRAKVLVLDANADITSKAALFRRVWAERHAGRVEYRPQHRLAAVDARASTLSFEVQDDVRADVLNVLPPMRAGRLAVDAGLATVNGRWCAVDYRSFTALGAPGVHVLGDAIQAAPGMPKSGHMANAQAKVAAAAIVAELSGFAPDPSPVLTNTCYSFVDAREAMHVASVHAWDATAGTLMPVSGAGGLSAAPSEAEGALAWGWARTIWADTLG